MAPRSFQDEPASSRARSTTPQMSRMCCREANSGTTPPHSRWIGTCDAMTLERIAHGFAASPVSSTTAADVSSQEVSIPRMRISNTNMTRKRENAKNTKRYIVQAVLFRGFVVSWFRDFVLSWFDYRADTDLSSNAAFNDSV